jgi:carbamoyl-phosphate synthase large subunit
MTLRHQYARIEKSTRFTLPSLFFLKKPVFSFSKLPGADTTLGPEMKSTGEMMLVGKTMEEVMGKAAGKNAPSQVQVYTLSHKNR